MRLGFTLIELLLVVIIIAIIYTIAFNTNITKMLEAESSQITIENLRTTLLKHKTVSNRVDLICSNDEMSCYLLIDGNTTKIVYELEQPINDYYITKDDEALIKYYDALKIGEVEVFPNFKYTIFKNSANSDNLVELKDGSFVYFDPYFTSPKYFPNSVDAISYIHKFKYMPQQIGIASD